ncbi:adenosylmethionine decarboxylase [Eleftheria terrae]|uniref:adenosylmethionine decarboxylase n=1 Tax=Eleftheria terrae TaxID=1597781 RepID=UPI00263B55E9|nr:adenosylmethionine decarboxylase [Eleftheria terrae]WKB51673.1 adenosylmethionine decarboxylase [Eleftheria terrae]
MHGLHLTADLLDCPAGMAAMTQVQALRELCVAEVKAAGLQPVGELFHAFEPAGVHGQPGGITGVVLLAESHLAVHTWPELGGVTLDVYVCNFGADNRGRAEALMQALLAAFRPGRVDRQGLERGRWPVAAVAAA